MSGCCSVEFQVFQRGGLRFLLFSMIIRILESALRVELSPFMASDFMPQVLIPLFQGSVLSQCHTPFQPLILHLFDFLHRLSGWLTCFNWFLNHAGRNIEALFKWLYLMRYLWFLSLYSKISHCGIREINFVLEVTPIGLAMASFGQLFSTASTTLTIVRVPLLTSLAFKMGLSLADMVYFFFMEFFNDALVTLEFSLFHLTFCFLRFNYFLFRPTNSSGLSFWFTYFLKSSNIFFSLGHFRFIFFNFWLFRWLLLLLNRTIRLIFFS